MQCSGSLGIDAMVHMGKLICGSYTFTLRSSIKAFEVALDALFCSIKTKTAIISELQNKLLEEKNVCLKKMFS